MRATLLIAAGGSGSRFQKTLDAKSAPSFPARKGVPVSKLFFPLCGKPLLEHTLSVFHPLPWIQEIIIAAPKGMEKEILKIALKNQWKKIKVTRGGETRAASVWNALRQSNPQNPWILVHDGARPFTSGSALQNLFKAAGKNEALLLAKKVIPTIKEGDSEGKIKRTVDRNVLFEAETPQMMKRSLLERAYRSVPHAMEATDESSLLEALKVQVHLVTHDDWNPKITTYKDLELAEAYLKRHQVSRAGFGYDTHRLVSGRKFMLGGIRIPHEKGPLGHSDGDALLHAVIDGILGALGAGDIGDWFSDQDPKHKNQPSSQMLGLVLKHAASKGFKVEHVDTVIILEKPKLGIYKQKIKQNLSKLLNLPAEAVSIKAKTAEGMGPEGQGLAITCKALVTLKSH